MLAQKCSFVYIHSHACCPCLLSFPILLWQTHTRISRWRKAEVAQLKRSVKDRVGGRGYEEEVMVLVHYIRWDEKWDRWISFTRNRERFAPYKTCSDSGDATGGWAGVGVGVF